MNNKKILVSNPQFVTGSKDCDKYMKNLFDDWQAQGIESVLHEKNSGYGHNRGAILGFS